MRTADFEKAIEALGCEPLEMVIEKPGSVNSSVKAAYGQVKDATTYVMWDETGRAFAYVQQEGSEDCVSEYNLKSLPYERDEKFDLKFE